MNAIYDETSCGPRNINVAVPCTDGPLQTSAPGNKNREKWLAIYTCKWDTKCRCSYVIIILSTRMHDKLVNNVNPALNHRNNIEYISVVAQLEKRHHPSLFSYILKLSPLHQSLYTKMRVTTFVRWPPLCMYTATK